MAVNADIRGVFFEECEELLEALTDGLTAIHDGAHDLETVNAVFRAVHSIKGGAGAFGLDVLVEFAHKIETVLDDIRAGTRAIDPDLIALLFRASDHLVDLVEGARDGRETDAETRLAILTELAAYISPEEEVDEEALAFQPMALDFSMDLGPLEGAGDDVDNTVYAISFRPHRSLYKNGHEPLFLFQALAALGALTAVLDLGDLPEFEEFDTADSYLSWALTLATDQPRGAIDEVFEFVEGLCDLDISEQAEHSGAADESADTAPLTPSAPQTPPEDAPLAPVSADSVKKPETKSAAETKGPKPTLRVDLDRVDRLINTVGELIINQAMLTQQISEVDALNTRDIESQLEDYKHLARDLQEGVMAIRAQPVKPLFQRMARIVREAASATNKNATLVMIGEGTEVDKTVVERLADPLTHMVRNAVDHGLESPDDRRAAGKDEIGEIRLSASHRSGSVYIEISDDGAGLNRKKVYDIAVQKGLITGDEELTDSEIDNLLFLPGFSTASEVSNLSGRGVGMDVVKNAVAKLGGRVAIASTPGKGTVFSVVLPLTLAVMDGMVISVAGQTMVVPITSILETIRPNADAVHPLGKGGPLLSIRGAFVPIIDVAQKLGLRAEPLSDQPSVLLLVESELSGQQALAVDAIIDQRQVVIKSLDTVYGNVAGVSAATILGDGKIAMIIDPDSVVQITTDPARDMKLEMLEEEV